LPLKHIRNPPFQRLFAAFCATFARHRESHESIIVTNGTNPAPGHALGAPVPLTRGPLTAAIGRLERRGLVRRHSPNVCRVRGVYLTVSGHGLIAGLFARHTQAIERLTRAPDNHELQQLTRRPRQPGKEAQALPAAAGVAQRK
jgi:hypothetical protein